MPTLSKKFLEQYIDVGMRNIIKKLNQKEYITAYCCEGHTTGIKSEKAALACPHILPSSI